MKKINNYQLSILIVIFLGAMATAYYLTNKERVISYHVGDTKSIKVYKYYNNEVKTRDKIIKFDVQGRVVTTLIWDEKGGLENKIVDFYRKGKRHQRNTVYYTDPIAVNIRGENLFKQKVKNIVSTVPSPNRKGDEYVYSKDRLIIFSEKYGTNGIEDIGYYGKDPILELLKSSFLKNGIIDVWTYYKDGNVLYSEYDSDGDGKPDKKGLPPVPEKNIITQKMGSK